MEKELRNMTEEQIEKEFATIKLQMMREELERRKEEERRREKEREEKNTMVQCLVCGGSGLDDSPDVAYQTCCACCGYGVITLYDKHRYYP